MPVVFIRENTVRYFALPSEMIFFFDLEISRKKIFGPAPETGHKRDAFDHSSGNYY